MKRIASGDRNAFPEFFKRFSSPVVITCTAILRNRSEAEEIAQEVFLRVLDKAVTFRDGSAAMWVRAIARNLSINRFRQRARRPDGARPEPTAGPVPVATPSLVLDVLAVLEKLDPHQRQALVLFYIDGYSYAEISELMGIPVAAVKSSIQNGRIQFAKWWNGGKAARRK